MKRPLSINWFERLYTLSVVLGTIGLIGTWDKTVELEVDENPVIWIGMIGALVAVYLVTFLFWFFIMHRRSNIARWLLTILTGLAAPLSFIDPDGSVNRDIWWVIEVTSTIIGVMAIVFLFKPDSKPWFDGRRDDLAETFS